MQFANSEEVLKMGFDRITQEPGLMGGQACVRSLRVTVSMIVGMVGAGITINDLLNDYPYLEHDDVTQSLQYAAWCPRAT
jgi:uncharacterized protein (DUF433 family)